MWCGSSPIGQFAEDVADAAQAVGWELKTERSENFHKRLGKSGHEAISPHDRELNRRR